MLLNSISARQFDFNFRHVRSFTILGLVLLAQLWFATPRAHAQNSSASMKPTASEDTAED